MANGTRVNDISNNNIVSRPTYISALREVNPVVGESELDSGAGMYINTS